MKAENALENAPNLPANDKPLKSIAFVRWLSIFEFADYSPETIGQFLLDVWFQTHPQAATTLITELRVHLIRAALMTVIIVLCAKLPAQAAFINGQENFSGTQLDSQTWATSTANTSAMFIQNNSLTIQTPASGPPFGYGGYTTTAALVPVSGSVWAEVRVNSNVNANASTLAELALDTDPHGVSSYLYDSVILDVDANFGQSSQLQFVLGSEGKTVNGFETGYLAPSLQSSALTQGSVYIFQIERLSSSSDRFSLFAETGPHAGGGTNISLIGTQTQSNITTSADMYVTLEAIGTDTTYLSVTVNNAVGLSQTFVVPEPSSMVLMGTALPLLLFAGFKFGSVKVPARARS
jgi:hypothetical protein